MYDVDCTCAKCNAKITQLPFMPSGDRPVYCADCNRAFREQRGQQERKMFKVDIKCADCGTAITELPFQPNGDSPVYCRGCFSKNR